MRSELEKKIKTCSGRRHNGVLTIVLVLKADDLLRASQDQKTDCFRCFPLTYIAVEVILVDGVDTLILWLEEDPSHV